MKRMHAVTAGGLLALSVILSAQSSRAEDQNVAGANIETVTAQTETAAETLDQVAQLGGEEHGGTRANIKKAAEELGAALKKLDQKIQDKLQGKGDAEEHGGTRSNIKEAARAIKADVKKLANMIKGKINGSDSVGEEHGGTRNNVKKAFKQIKADFSKSKDELRNAFGLPSDRD